MDSFIDTTTAVKNTTSAVATRAPEEAVGPGAVSLQAMDTAACTNKAITGMLHVLLETSRAGFSPELMAMAAREVVRNLGDFAEIPEEASRLFLQLLLAGALDVKGTSECLLVCADLARRETVLPDLDRASVAAVVWAEHNEADVVGKLGADLDLPEELVRILYRATLANNRQSGDTVTSCLVACARLGRSPCFTRKRRGQLAVGPYYPGRYPKKSKLAAAGEEKKEGPSILVECTPLYPGFRKGDPFLVPFLMDIRPLSNSPVSSPPLCLCVVLDRSTSMSGRRWADATRSVCEVIHRAPEGTVLTVVAFGDGAEVVLRNMKIDGSDCQKTRLQHIVSALEVGGMTNMGAGLRLAGDLLRDTICDDRVVKRVLVFSDGHINTGCTATKELCDLARNAGGVVDCFGIGTDIPRDLLAELASSAGGGSVYVINESQEIVTVVTNWFDDFNNLIGTDCQVRVSTDEFVTLKQRRHNDEGGGDEKVGSLTLEVGDLIKGDHCQKLFWAKRLDVSSEEGGDVRFKVVVEFKSTAEGRPVVRHESCTVFTSLASHEEQLKNQMENPRVKEAVALEKYQAIDKVVRSLLDNHKLEEARMVISKAKEDLGTLAEGGSAKLAAFLHQLEGTLQAIQLAEEGEDTTDLACNHMMRAHQTATRSSNYHSRYKKRCTPSPKKGAKSSLGD